MGTQRSNYTRPVLISTVALAGLVVGFFLGPLSPPHPVQALRSSPREPAVLSVGEVSVVINAILYDVVTYFVDLPVIMDNAS